MFRPPDDLFDNEDTPEWLMYFIAGCYILANVILMVAAGYAVWVAATLP